MSDVNGADPGSPQTSDAGAASGPGAPVTPASAPRGRRTLWVVAAVVAALVGVAAIWWLQGTTTVPNVTGASQDTATAGLEAAGLAVGRTTPEATLDVAPGTVTAQSPKAGASARKGDSVDLVIASLPTTTVPDVVGMTGSEAEAELAVAGLRVGAVDGVYTTAQPAGTVLAQSPEGSTEAPVAAVVDLEVSAGPKQGAVPDVTGLASVDANDVLVTAGFAVKETSKESADVAAGVVMSQAPPAGTVAQEGATVTLTVSTGSPEAAEPVPPADNGDQAAPPATPEPPTTPEAPPAEMPTPKPEPSITEVPDLIGMRVLEAFTALRKADLQFSIEWGPTDEDVLRVIAQEPSAGADVDRGSVVNVTIGLPSFLFDGVEVQPLPTEPSGADGSEAATDTTQPAQ